MYVDLQSPAPTNPHVRVAKLYKWSLWSAHHIFCQTRCRSHMADTFGTHGRKSVHPARCGDPKVGLGGLLVSECDGMPRAIALFVAAGISILEVGDSAMTGAVLLSPHSTLERS